MEWLVETIWLVAEYWMWNVSFAVLIWYFWYFTKTVLSKIEEWFTKISLSIWKTVLPSSQIQNITRDKMFKQSEDKLKYLKDLLIKNSIQERKETLKENIRTELMKQSAIYIQELNNYNTSAWLVGDYIYNNFPMDKFLKDLYTIFFEDIKNKNKELVIENKINDIRSLMSRYQQKTVKDLYNIIKD